MAAMIPADKILLRIQEILETNSSSLLGFKTEQEKANEIVKRQHDKVTCLQALHKEMTDMLEQSEVTIESIKEIKREFEQVHKEYLEEYSLLKELYLMISVSFTAEKYILKRCFFGESDQALSQIMEKNTDQDLQIAQLNEVINALEEG